MDAEREVGGRPIARDHGLGEVRRDRREQGAGVDSAAGRRAEQVGERERGAELGRILPLLAGVALLVPVRCEDPPLEVRHPGDHLRPREIAAVDQHVDLPRHPRLLLERVDVAQGGHVLRHELAHVRSDVRLGVRRPAQDGERQARDQDVARALDREVERGAAAAGAPPRGDDRRVADRFTHTAPGDALPGGACERPGAREHRGNVGCARGALREAGERRYPGRDGAPERQHDPHDHGHGEPVDHRHRGEQQHQEAGRGGQGRTGDQGAAAHGRGPGGGSRVEPPRPRLVVARLQLNRVVHRETDQHR